MTAPTLEKRVLGKSGIPVTSIGLGLWAAGGGFWGETDDRQSREAMDAAVEEGVTFFDTADVYGNGHSEELLGAAMQGRRDRFQVATKIGWQGFDGAKKASAYTTVDRLVAGVESNLRRLRTDHVELIQCHIGFREPNMEVFVEGFQRLRREGKVRAYGVSTSDLEHLKAFNADGGCAALQIDYSLLNRTAEAEIFPYCRANAIGVIVRGPLAMGILTGKFSADRPFPEGDFRKRWQADPAERAVYRQDLEKVEKLRALARGGRSLAQLALQFAMAHPAVTTVIPGAKTAGQLRENVSAARLPALTAEERAVIDGITPPGDGRKIWPA